MAKGVVGVVSGSTSRFTEFTHALFSTAMPPEWQLLWERGISVAKNRNEIVKKALTDSEVEHIWFMDDDHVFAPDILLKLLARDVDIVSPLYAKRLPLFLPHFYHKMDTSMSKGYLVECLPWELVPTEGIHEVAAVAGGGLLIKRHVFEKIGFPWFTNGYYTRDGIHEDLYFSQRAKEEGFKLYVDVENCLGHLTQCAVWPNPPNGIELRFGEMRIPLNIKRG